MLYELSFSLIYSTEVLNQFQEQIDIDKAEWDKFVDELERTGTEGNKLSYLQEVLSIILGHFYIY